MCVFVQMLIWLVPQKTVRNSGYRIVKVRTQFNKVFIVIYNAGPLFKNMSISYYYCNAELAVFKYYTIKEDVSFKLLKIVHFGLNL